MGWKKKARGWVWAGLGASLFCLPGCASLPSTTGLQVFARKGRPFVIVKTDKASGWGVANHVFLCRLSEKRIAMTYWIAGDGTTDGISPVTWPVYTDDGGKTWQFGDPYKYLDGLPADLETYIEKGGAFKEFRMGIFFAGARLPSGTRVVFSQFAHATSTHHFNLLALRSEDGENWRGPAEVSFRIQEDALLIPRTLNFEGKAVVTPDKRILCATYGTVAAQGPCTFLFESCDEGESFDLVSCVATPADAPWGMGQACEPALALLPNGELLCIMRTGGYFSPGGTAVAQPMLAARSRDGGRTWKYQKMPFEGVMPKLELMSNGILVLATGRPGNRLYFSTDGGRTWGREVVLTRPLSRTSGYCDVLEVSRGRLLVVYDTLNTDMSGIWLWEPKEVNGIFGVFVNVKKLF